MANFPIVRSKKTLPSQGPNVLMDMDVTTGQGQVWQAVTQLGGTVMDLGQRFALMQADTQFSDAKLKARQEINRLSMELEKNPDSDTYQKALNDSISKLWTFQPKNGVAAREYEKWINGMIPTMEGAVNESRRRREITNFKAMGIKIFNEGNMTEYRTHILKGKAIGAYEADDAEILLHDADMRDVFNQAMTMPLENGIDHIKFAKNLTVNEQQSLVDDLKFKKEKEIANLKIAQEAKYKEFMSQIWNGKLDDVNMVRQAWISGEIDEPQYEKLEKVLLAPSSNENDPMALADAYKVMRSDMTEQQKLDEIIKLSPKLKTTTRDNFIKETFKPTTTQRQAAKTYFDLLESLYKDDKLGAESKRESALIYNKMYEQLDKFDKDNPDATPDKWAEVFEEVIEPATRATTNWFWRWLTSPVSISELHKMGYKGSIKKMMADYKRDKAAGTKQRRPGESIDEYLERTQ